ncbi:MAG: FIVAR domain-containing protein [Clostridia bacterium]|nr:FIVAR domain-containing protein [Clostridia bacterium]
MIKTKKNILLLLTLIICFCSVLFIGADFSYVKADVSTVEQVVKSYEFGESNKYKFSSATEVETMTFGKKSLGSLSISGEIDDISTYRNKTAYGVLGNISFSYNYDGSLLSTKKKEWHLVADTGKKVDDISLSGSIDKGVLIVQTSQDAFTWTNAVNPVVNFFADNPSGMENFYTTDGSQVAEGCFYRVILAYKTGKKTGTSGVWPFQYDVYKYKKHVEVYEFYLCANSGVISLHNLSVDDEMLETDEYALESVKKGETLLDGATTTGGFSVDKLGTSYLVNVKKDNEEGIYVDDGAEFTENGKYEITTLTKLGKEVSQTIYVFNGGEDCGLSTYFDSTFIQGNRVFRYGDYPTYAKGSYGKIKAISDSVPILKGRITNLNTNEIVEIEESRNEQTFNFTQGTYCAEFINGQEENGSFYKYTFYFNIIDEESAPYVNYNNFMKTERLMDLGAKHYEVAYQTTAGGYIFVCFALDSYDEAFSYAYEIEKRFIEQTEDNDGLYYKSKDNPNLKVKYYDYLKMTEVVNYYACKNIEYNYFNANDAFTYQTFDNDLLEELESLSIKDSIRVFPSQEEREKLISRQPFINNFTFINVADYDVVSVSAYCYADAKTYNLEFDKDVSSQLVISSKYRITETNIYGDSVSYDVYYLNQNHTVSTWNVIANNQSTTLTVSNDFLVDNKIEVTADAISISSIVNNCDSSSIVTIKAPDVYSFEIKCLISELKDVGLYKKGKYELTFIDRVGNSYKFIINITGNLRYSEVVDSVTKSFTNLYNSIYLNQKTENEEIIYDTTALKSAIDRVVDSNNYTNTSYENYQNYLQIAINVYQNDNATQEEINKAGQDLETAYLALVPVANKTELLKELERFENAEKGKYTTSTYNAWRDAYNEGKLSVNNKDASELEVENAVSIMKNAFDSLVERGDKSNLYLKLEEVRAVDCLLYTPNTVEALSLSYEQAVLVFEDIDALQTQIDIVVNSLNEKLLALCFVADFSELYDLIEQVNLIDSTIYTTATVEELKAKYDNAVVVYKDRNYSQVEVNNATTSLSQAKNALVLCGNETMLANLVAEISQLAYMLYSKDTIKPLLLKYNNAVDVLEGRFAQSEIDELTDELRELKSSLIIRQDKLALYNTLMQMSKIDLSNYSKEKAEKFISVYDYANTVLYSLDSSEMQVLTANSKIEQAKDNLQDDEEVALWVCLLIIVGVIIYCVYRCKNCVGMCF